MRILQPGGEAAAMEMDSKMNGRVDQQDAIGIGETRPETQY